MQIRGMHTLIRDSQTMKHDFVFYADRLIHLVVEHGLRHLLFTEKQVITPTASVCTGVDFCKILCGVPSGGVASRSRVVDERSVEKALLVSRRSYRAIHDLF